MIGDYLSHSFVFAGNLVWRFWYCIEAVPGSADIPVCSTGPCSSAGSALEVLWLSHFQLPMGNASLASSFCSTLHSTKSPPHLHSLLLILFVGFFPPFFSLNTVSDGQVWVMARCQTAETEILETHSSFLSGCWGFLTPATPQKIQY